MAVCRFSQNRADVPKNLASRKAVSALTARIHAVAATLQTGDRLVADANTGWTQHEAMRVVKGVRDVDVYIGQPRLTYEECLSARRHTDHPFVLDENIDSPDVARQSV